MISSNFTFLLDKSNECFLVFLPILENVSGWREQTYESNVEREIWSNSMFIFGVINQHAYLIIVRKFISTQLLHLFCDLLNSSSIPRKLIVIIWDIGFLWFGDLLFLFFFIILVLFIFLVLLLLFAIIIHCILCDLIFLGNIFFLLTTLLQIIHEYFSSFVHSIMLICSTARVANRK